MFYLRTFFQKTNRKFLFSMVWTFFMDVTSIGRCNPKKRLTHNTIKAGCQNKIIIIKWKGRCYLRTSSRADQASLTETEARLLIDDQHNTNSSLNGTDEDDVELSDLDESESEQERSRRMQNSGRLTGFLQNKWMISHPQHGCCIGSVINNLDGLTNA